MNSFDLHMHSHYSTDGEFPPEELIQKAKSANLTTIALSDHNTVDGVEEMMALANKAGIRVIPAIELDTLFEDLEVHVLGYQIDIHAPYFHEISGLLKERKQVAMKQRLLNMNKVFSLDLDPEALIKRFGSRNPFPQIINMIMSDPRYKDKPEFQPYRPGGERCEPQAVNFYWDNCSAGKPCYTRVEYPSLADTVKIIHEHGGIAVIAHPWINFYKEEARLQRALACGIDGIEAFSNYHNSEQNAYYEKYCQDHNVLMTCGSDFHGKLKPAIRMGEYGYPHDADQGEQILAALLQAIA